MANEKSKKKPSGDSRPFWLRCVVLVVMILAVGWCAWFLPRGRSKAVTIVPENPPVAASALMKPIAHEDTTQPPATTDQKSEQSSVAEKPADSVEAKPSAD